MTKGKICAQTAHAVLAVYKDLSGDPDDPAEAIAGDPVLMAQWVSLGYPKVTFAAGSIKDLYSAEENARKNKIHSCCVHDAGRTQVEPNTPTVCAFGPCEWSKVKEYINKSQY